MVEVPCVKPFSTKDGKSSSYIYMRQSSVLQKLRIPSKEEAIIDDIQIIEMP